MSLNERENFGTDKLGQFPSGSDNTLLLDANVICLTGFFRVSRPLISRPLQNGINRSI